MVCSYANKVGPFSNPSETYQYYDLPFCRPEGGLEHKPETLGEVPTPAMDCPVLHTAVLPLITGSKWDHIRWCSTVMRRGATMS